MNTTEMLLKSQFILLSSIIEDLKDFEWGILGNLVLILGIVAIFMIVVFNVHKQNDKYIRNETDSDHVDDESKRLKDEIDKIERDIALKQKSINDQIDSIYTQGNNSNEITAVEIEEQKLVVPFQSTYYPESRSYPILHIPMEGEEVTLNSYIQPKTNSIAIADFLKQLEHLFGDDFFIYDNAILEQFEMDIAMAHKLEPGLRFNIEIDEPYNVVTREKQHYGIEDIVRDEAVCDLGWFTVRFTEFQIIYHLNECLKYLNALIKEMKEDGPVLDFPSNLVQNKWTYTQARTFEETNYIEGYLIGDDSPYVSHNLMEEEGSIVEIKKNKSIAETPFDIFSVDIPTEIEGDAGEAWVPIKVDLPDEDLEEQQIDDIVFFEFDSNGLENLDDFPVVIVPEKGCVVRSYSFGRKNIRGYKEADFEEAIRKLWGDEFEVYGNLCLNNNARAYEPDIAMVSKSLKGLRVDIEIDEPYAGITRRPTHCIGDDDLRNNYFKNRGWVVIRFTERQVHLHEDECVLHIGEVITKLLPGDYKRNHCPPKEKQWDVLQAQKWEKELYRENYLNHSFGRVDISSDGENHGLSEQEELEEKLVTEEETIYQRPNHHAKGENFTGGTVDHSKTQSQLLTQREIKEEELVRVAQIGTEEIENPTSFNLLNQHPRDSRIKFYPDPHIYTIDGIEAKSASTLVSRFFPEFDAAYWSERKAPELGMSPFEIREMWAKKGRDASNDGTYLHKQIENYFLGRPYNEPPEFRHFIAFRNEHQHLEPIRSEWRIFDDEFLVAGTIDLLVENEGETEIYDWKRSKKVLDPLTKEPITYNSWQDGIGILSGISDTHYNRYCIQQSIYRYILEKNYNKKISEMYLVVLHPQYNNYYKLKVPYYKKEAEQILKSNR